MRPAISLVLSSLALCSGYLLRAAPPLRRRYGASHAVRMQTAEEPPNPLMELSIELTSFSGPAFKPEPLEEEKLATGQVVVCTVLKKLEPFPGSRKSRGYEVDIGGVSRSGEEGRRLCGSHSCQKEGISFPPRPLRTHQCSEHRLTPWHRAPGALTVQLNGEMS